eukprot:SAG31_NODE_18409_length_637_cov_1.343866_1_plen_24_part_10
MKHTPLTLTLTHIHTQKHTVPAAL